MINLLPHDYKQDITFARRNSVLRNWLIASILGVVGIVLIIAAGHLFIARSTVSWQKQVDQSKEQLNAQKLDETQKHITDISDSIKLTTQVLSREILFSKLLTQVGAAMPPGTSLQSLSISSTQGGIDLTAGATTYQAGTQVQINLSDPANKIFDKADITSIACLNDPKNTSPYPCTVTIRALFAKDNAFQYVTSKGTKQ